MTERDYNVIPSPTQDIINSGLYGKWTNARTLLPIHLAALLYAYDEIGVEEVTEDWSPRIKEYLVAADITVPAPWCGAFCIWAISQAAKAKLAPNPLKDLSLKAYVQSYYNYAKTQKKLIPLAQVAPGDLFMIYYPSLKRYGHIGFVYDRQGDIIHTIEGNSNSTGAREGTQVVQRSRKDGINIVYFRYV